MSTELNIGLLSSKYIDCKLTPTRRLKLALAHLEPFWHGTGVGPDTRVTGVRLDRTPGREPTLVVKIEGHSVTVTRHLCELLEQDCIAVRWPRVPGMLVGPRAGLWGEFREEDFVRF